MRGRHHDFGPRASGEVAVRISIHDTGADLSAQLASNRSGQRRVCRIGEKRKLVVHARLVPFQRFAIQKTRLNSRLKSKHVINGK